MKCFSNKNAINFYVVFKKQAGDIRCNLWQTKNTCLYSNAISDAPYHSFIMIFVIIWVPLCLTVLVFVISCYSLIINLVVCVWAGCKSELII